MFSGIIDGIGETRDCTRSASGKRLRIRAAGYWAGLAPGASVAVDGVCLTVVEHDEAEAAFDVVAETLRCTTLGDLRPGDAVNLQKSLAVGERIDGHFVQGHVDATAVIDGIDRAGGESLWWFATSAEAMRYIIPKGSVAVDGISLTVAALKPGRFATALIPTTLERTTIGRKKIGDRVNIETDMIARTVVRRLESMAGSPGVSQGGLSLSSLQQHGFA
jgi:riboflavin synthase alpha subunit